MRSCPGWVGRGLWRKRREWQRSVRLSSATALIDSWGHRSRVPRPGGKDPRTLLSRSPRPGSQRPERQAWAGPGSPGEEGVQLLLGWWQQRYRLCLLPHQALPPHLHIFSRACASVSFLTSHVGWRAHGPQHNPISKEVPMLKIQVDIFRFRNHWGTHSTSTGVSEPVAGWAATLSLEGSLEELHGPGAAQFRGNPRTWASPAASLSLGFLVDSTGLF